MYKYKVGDLVWIKGKNFYYEGKITALMLGIIDHYYKISPIENSSYSPTKDIDIGFSEIKEIGLAS